jgi:D-alanyl-D-alanine carboxypeptidase (penicillin-binding protein 5/6)
MTEREPLPQPQLLPPLPNDSGSRRTAIQAFVAIAAAVAVILAGLALSGALGDDGNGSTAVDPATVLTTTTSSTTSSTTVAPTTVAPTTVAPSTVAPTTASSTTSAAPVVPVPAVDATAYAVYDPASDRWLAESNADDARAVGSVMKLLSAYVAMQAAEPERMVTVPPLTLDPAESAIGLREGEQYSRALLLRAMLIVSANDAARTLAIDVSGTEAAFVDQMNVAAQALGLTNTVAANPVGLDDPAARSTAHDMAKLGAALMQDATFRETVARRSASLHGTTFAATNKLLERYEGADGVKTGRTTQAGWCVVGSATRGGRQIIVVVLGASSDEARLASAEALLDWAFEQ